VTLLHDFHYQAMVYDVLDIKTHGPVHDLYRCVRARDRMLLSIDCTHAYTRRLTGVRAI
jgi:hypothetical protein